MGLDVSLGIIVGYVASDFIEKIEVETKQFPKRDEITGEPIEGMFVNVYFTYLITKNGKKVLVGEKKRK